MPIIDKTVNEYIDEAMIAENKKRDEDHKSSGLLSASMLYQPLRFQVLKTLGTPRKEFDAYTLAKFKRGRDVEDWYVEQLKGAGVLVEKDLEDHDLIIEEGKQAKAEYRSAIGYVDSVIDTDLMQSKKGILPNEIKSVTNMKMKRVAKTGIDYHYKLQAVFYALAMKKEHYAVTIVSSEDLRSDMQIFRTSELEGDVKKIIGNYQRAMQDWSRGQMLPPFEANPKVPWTKNVKYAMFEEFWVTAPDHDVIKKMEELGVI